MIVLKLEKYIIKNRIIYFQPFFTKRLKIPSKGYINDNILFLESMYYFHTFFVLERTLFPFFTTLCDSKKGSLEL